jgi:L-lactate utilization protein LutC
MKNEEKYITEEHQDHVKWTKDLEFYTEDLAFLRKQLEEVSSKNTATEVKQEVEKYQNQFIIQKNEIDILNHAINAEEELLVENVVDNPVAVDHRKVEDNVSLRDRVETFAKLFKEMKGEFNTFLAKNF